MRTISLISIAITLAAIGCQPKSTPPTETSTPTTRPLAPRESESVARDADVQKQLKESEAQVWKSMTGTSSVIRRDAAGYGFLGVMFAKSPPPLVISHVIPRTGAAEAGVREGDKIVAWGDYRLPDAQMIKNLIRASSAGDVVSLVIERGGSERELHVRLISVEELDELWRLDPASGGER